MPKGKGYGGGGRHNNQGGGAKAGPGGTNRGKSGGLRKEDSQRADVMKKPSTTNRYPNGLS